MNLFDIGYTMLHGIKNIGKPAVSYSVFESQFPKDVTGETEPQNVLSIYTAAKILSGSISQMDIKITKNNEDYTSLPMYYALKYRMNDVQNNQTFFSTLEYHRNVYGNAFVDLRKGNNEIIHPSLVTDYDFKGVKNSLRFFISWSSESNLDQDKYNTKKMDEWIASKDLLHFKGMSVDGIFGLPPVSAAAQAMGILDKASNTIRSFYDNRAMSPMALESTIATAGAAKTTLEGLNTFNSKYKGTYAAGKTLQLPPNTKLTPLAIQFRDAELVATMKFSKEEIFTMYGIPSYMYASTNELQGDIEQQALSFKTFTLAPITVVYEEELEYKLLSKEERMSGVDIGLDMDSLLVADLKTKTTAYRDMVTSGIISPNEGAESLGFNKVDNKWMDMHYLQSQNIPLELYDEYSKADISKTNDKKEE